MQFSYQISINLLLNIWNGHKEYIYLLQSIDPRFKNYRLYLMQAKKTQFDYKLEQIDSRKLKKKHYVKLFEWNFGKNVSMHFPLFNVFKSQKRK